MSTCLRLGENPENYVRGKNPFSPLSYKVWIPMVKVVDQTVRHLQLSVSAIDQFQLEILAYFLRPLRQYHFDPAFVSQMHLIQSHRVIHYRKELLLHKAGILPILVVIVVLLFHIFVSGRHLAIIRVVEPVRVLVTIALIPKEVASLIR